jgi:thioredoxin 1
VLKADRPVLVKFQAKWCGACRIVAPTIQGLSGEYAGRVGFVEIDVDRGRELAGKYGIRSIPAVFVFKNGEQLNEIIGAKDAGTYRSALDSALDG